MHEPYLVQLLWKLPFALGELILQASLGAVLSDSLNHQVSALLCMASRSGLGVGRGSVFDDCALV